jgi:hypothetical protein
VELVAAWRAWDKQPTAEHTANRMIRACSAAGKALGIPGHKVHDELIQGRREGMEYEQALARLRLSITTPAP